MRALTQGRLLQKWLGLLALLLCMCANANPVPAGTTIRSEASATYVPGGFTQLETVSNAVEVRVLPVEALVLTQDQNIMSPPGMTVSLSHLLKNTGNDVSSYTFSLMNDSRVTGCAAQPLALSRLRLVRDVNSNGVVDGAETAIALNVPNVVTLRMGESTSLIVQGIMPLSSTGAACLTLTVKTVDQNISVRNQDVITISNAAVLALNKSASFDGLLLPGSSQVNFTISGSNVGAGDVLPTNVTLPALSNVIVDQRAVSLILIRDVIPAGTHYVTGSLQSPSLGAIKLYRLSGDPAFSYRTAGDDASAVEVAIGIAAPGSIPAGAGVQMRFSVSVDSGITTDILNAAQAYYNDGSQTTSSTSNTTLSPLSLARIGLAKKAATPVANLKSDGTPDGTNDVTFSMRVKNYGTTWLYGVQITDVMEGALNTQFGAYTSASVPGLNQYTIVPNSLSVQYPFGVVGGTVAQINTAFKGTADQSELLSAGAVLPTGAEVTVVFTARFNNMGRTSPVFNQASANATLSFSSGQLVSDLSVDGADPDPDRDGNPNNNAGPTAVASQLPSIKVTQSIDVPQKISAGVYDIRLTYYVTNNSAVDASYIRVISNLNCTFEMDLASGPIEGWSINDSVKSKYGYLLASGNFTGNSTCDRSKASSASPFQFPTQIVLSTVDGTRSLSPGQTEEISFQVRVTLKSSARSTVVQLTNKVWASAAMQNTINMTADQVLAATVSADASSLPTNIVDPAGTVYDAKTRQPVAGAKVTMTRQRCTSGTLGPILPSEILGGSVPGKYTFLSDGSVSVLTDANGAWNFNLLSPPVNNLCTYGINVVPPANSGYIFPSEIIPKTAGTFTSCGEVVPNGSPPQGNDLTTYYLEYDSGLKSDASLCGVTNAHIPLDPGHVNGLVLKKEANQQRVEFGDFLDYALTLTNKVGAPLSSLTFHDQLPAGFAYVPGSAKFNGAKVADPVGGFGPQLDWTLASQTLAVDQAVVLRYRVRIGVGAQLDASATNKALAAAGAVQSNLATHTVRVDAGVFSDKAFIFGKVYMACGKDVPEDQMMGVPGVRLWLVDGTFAVTDANGKWSLYGLRPQTQVVRLDETTLPKGARVELLDHRNAGNAASRFADLKKGEFHKANFPISSCENPGILAEVESRKAAAMKLLDAQMDADTRVRIDPKGAAVGAVDTRTLPATGSQGAAGLLAPAPAGGALIQMPASRAVVGQSFVASNGAGGMSGTLSMAQSQVRPTLATPASHSQAPAAENATQTEVNGEPFAPLLQLYAPDAVDLEELMPELDNAPAFMDLKPGDTLPSQSLNVRVKGPVGTQLRLWVNDVAVDLKRVGKKATLPKTSTTAWEYIGVLLKPGQNTLRLEVWDEFGVRRAEPVDIVVTAPDKLAVVHLTVPAQGRADMKTLIPVQIRLTDAKGIPVTSRTPLTVETSGGTWAERDLNPDEPGLQLFLEGGQGEVHLIPPGLPGDVVIRVTTATLMKEVRVSLLPELRPMIAVGIVEGTLDLSQRGALNIGQTPAAAAFEQELSALGGSTDSRRAGGRAAFFLKGAIKGEYLLTASLDTAKSSKERLFREIRPDEFYPVYGDASGKGFDAQSSERLYVRIDKDRSFLLYGDFITASSQEVRKLSQVNRTLTGLKNVYNTPDARVTSFVSRTSQKKQVEEFPANSTSGPFYLAGDGNDLLANSEQIEIVVRDRYQPNVILSKTVMVRFVDYTFEPLSRRILFTRAIPALTADLNPQSIRTTYEVDSGGAKFTVAGVDAQMKVNDQLQLGIVANTDQNPDAKRDLVAVTALARLGSGTAMAAEWVNTQTALSGTGNAGRVEIRHEDEQWGASAQVVAADAHFDNPDAGLPAGRTEANARAEYRIDKTTAVRSEYSQSHDGTTGATKQSVNTGVLTKINDNMTGELGLRYVSGAANASTSLFSYGSVSTAGAGATGGGQVGASVTQLGTAANIASADSGLKEIKTVRAKLTANVPDVPQAQVFLEAEQSVDPANKGRVAAVGGQFALTEKARLYGRYEFDSSLYALSSPQVTRNVGIFGVESNYMEGGRVYNEYRLADANSARGSQAATGVRNMIKLNEHWRTTIGLEQTRAVGLSSTGVAGQGDSKALITGLEYANDGIRGSGILEGRHGSDVDTMLASVGLGLRLDQDWSFLTRNIYNASRGVGVQLGNERILSRNQIGLAYRPVDQDVWNLLTKYEHKSEHGSGSTATVGSISGNAFGNNANLNGDYVADILSLHLNVNPRRGQYFMGRVAAKRSALMDSGLKTDYSAQLLSGRWIQDLAANWDWGLQANFMHSAGALQHAWGVEAGYQVMKDLWLSVGYNFTGLSDRDLTAGEYTSKGLYLRIRFKFDESTLGSSASKEKTAN